jgi:hypothetical protein
MNQKELDALRAKHWAVDTGLRWDECAECFAEYPCDVIKVIAELEKAWATNPLTAKVNELNVITHFEDDQ